MVGTGKDRKFKNVCKKEKIGEIDKATDVVPIRTMDALVTGHSILQGLILVANKV